MRFSHIFSIGIIFLQDISSEPNIWYCDNPTAWCYTIAETQTRHAHAKSWCRSHNAKLVSIATFDENVYVGRLCGPQSCWIGLEERSEGYWIWSDGSRKSYINWAGGEPNNFNGENEMFTVMNIVMPQHSLKRVDSGWYDVGDGFSQGVAICKKRIPVPYSYSCPSKET